jgi:hypothetical protein
MNKDQISAANPLEFSRCLKKQTISIQMEMIVHYWTIPLYLSSHV